MSRIKTDPIPVAPHEENFLELPDGRRLCYARYGDPGGRPVFAFHGNPSSRLLWGRMKHSPIPPGIDLIAPDRPGFGQSDFVQGVTTLENWPHDTALLADTLGIDKFAVFGPSGGGPYALACAWKIPERLTAAGIFAGVGPLVPETAADMLAPVRKMWSWSPRAPGLFRLQMKLIAWLVRNHPAAYIKMIRGEFGDIDREVYTRLDLAKANQQDRLESYRQDGIGSWYDTMIPANWPIPLNEIKAKVYLWQGEKDVTVPPSTGRYLADRIPDCEATFIKDAGHFWLFEHLTEMLAKVAGIGG